MANFNIGDVVRLKSGGPAMTVEAVAPSGGGLVCVWFNKDGMKFETQSSVFPVETLDAAKKA